MRKADALVAVLAAERDASSGCRAGVWRRGLRLWRGFAAGFGAVAVQDIGDPFAVVARAANGDRKDERDHFPGADHIELARGGDDGWPRYNKAADFFSAWQNAMSSPACNCSENPPIAL